MQTRIRSVSQCAFIMLMALSATCVRTVSAQDDQSRVRNYVGSLVGPGALFSIGLSAVIDHAQNDPAEWEKTSSGFMKRAGSAAGARFANQTVRHGLAAVMDRSTTYQRCGCTAFGARLGHAIIGAITDTGDSGHSQISIPAIAGAAAGAYAPIIWRPDYGSRQAFEGIGISLGTSALGNIVQEFILH